MTPCDLIWGGNSLVITGQHDSPPKWKELCAHISGRHNRSICESSALRMKGEATSQMEVRGNVGGKKEGKEERHMYMEGRES